MRNSLPAMVHVQTEFAAVAGQLGVGVEGSNATVQGDDKFHSNSGNTLVLPPLDPYGPATRYFDIFSRGNKDCAWTAVPAQPWVKLSQSKGTISPNGPDTRVLVSIDWAAAPAAPYSGTVNINISPCRGMDRYGFNTPIIQLPVQNRRVPSNFTSGFVESDGHVAFSGAHYQSILPASKSSKQKINYHTFSSYGRTSSGVGLTPLSLEKLTIETAPALQYNVYLFSNHSAVNVTLYLSPALNYLGDSTPLEYGISLTPLSTSKTTTSPSISDIQFVRPVNVTVGGNMPDGWGGAVADGVWGRRERGEFTTSRFKVAQEGGYVLRVWALMPGVVVQKVVVDLGGVRGSYLGPPEGFLVGRDVIGAKGKNGESFLGDEGVAK